MPNHQFHAEHILLAILFIALLLSLWKNNQAQIKRLHKKGKITRPRQLKPKTPKNCPGCREGVELMVGKPRTDVVAYAQHKSSRGRTKRLATQGHACPNPNCPYFGVVDQQLHALVGNGKRGKDKEIQYWRCQMCRKDFTSRLHTPLYCLKSDEGQIILVLMLLAEGCDFSVLVRCSGHSEATVSRWLERMGKHSGLLHNRYFQGLLLSHVQVDELCCWVRRVGKMWLWLAIDPVTKILPSLHLGQRKNDDAMALIHDLKQRLRECCVPAFTSDGLNAYFYALTAHFGKWYRPVGARLDRWKVSELLLHGQLVKQRKRGKTKFAVMRMLWGKRCLLTARLKENGFSALIQTAFIERVNLTIRRGVSSLMRKTWSLAQTPEHLLLHCEWWRAYYHFVRPHESLALKVPGLGRYRQRTPAVAARLVSGNWTVRDILMKPLSPMQSP
jgi:transposase-like protein/IS1 family transposase